MFIISIILLSVFVLMLFITENKTKRQLEEERTKI